MSQYAGIDGQRGRERRRRAVPALQREQPVGRGRIGRSCVDDREVHRPFDPARPRRAWRRARRGRRRPRIRRGPRPPRATSAGAAGWRARHRRSGRRLPSTSTAACPASGLVEQRVLVEVGVGGESVRRRSVTEDRPHRRPEDLGEVEVDGAHRPVEVHLLVHEPPGGQEHLEGAAAPGRTSSGHGPR